MIQVFNLYFFQNKYKGKKINVINLSQQTEISDLLGSYKPVDIKAQMKILKDKFLDLFSKNFSIQENETFLNHIKVNLMLILLFYDLVIQINFKEMLF